MTRKITNNPEEKKGNSIIEGAKKIIKTANDIVVGVSNYSDGVMPDFYQSRKSICLACDKLKTYTNNIEGSISRYQCLECGCLMEAKWRSPGARCPLNKWVS
jgi:hypothetical protein